MMTDIEMVLDWANRAETHMSKADKQSAKYERIKAKVKESPEYVKARDDMQRKILEVNWGMRDALSAYSFHINEANRLHQAIIARHALRQMQGG
jgi:hypothetical protein